MKLYTIAEAAETIRMSKGWIRAAIRSGELPATRFGRSVRISEESLTHYCRVKTEGTPESIGISLSDSAGISFRDKSTRYTS